MTDAVTVSLRPLNAEDAPTLAGWGRDPDFVAAADWSERSYEEYLELWSGRILRPRDGLLRLAALVDDELVGYADLSGDEPTHRELGYVVGPRSRWGLGYGGEVARLMTSYAFERMGLDEVRAEALDANTASVRILQRLGMTETGCGEGGAYLGRPTYYRCFAITRPAWAQARLQGR